MAKCPENRAWRKELVDLTFTISLVSNWDFLWLNSLNKYFQCSNSTPSLFSWLCAGQKTGTQDWEGWIADAPSEAESFDNLQTCVEYTLGILHTLCKTQWWWPTPQYKLTHHWPLFLSSNYAPFHTAEYTCAESEFSHFMSSVSFIN